MKRENSVDDLYSCDLNPAKTCDNCGKCFDIEGYDVKAIEIDDMFESSEDMSEYDELNKLHEGANALLDIEEELWDYIDDIKEIKDLMEEDVELQLQEEYPGLFVYKKDKENKEDK